MNRDFLRRQGVRILNAKVYTRRNLAQPLPEINMSFLKIDNKNLISQKDILLPDDINSFATKSCGICCVYMVLKQLGKIKLKDQKKEIENQQNLIIFQNPSFKSELETLFYQQLSIQKILINTDPDNFKSLIKLLSDLESFILANNFSDHTLFAIKRNLKKSELFPYWEKINNTIEILHNLSLYSLAFRAKYTQLLSLIKKLPEIITNINVKDLLNSKYKMGHTLYEQILKQFGKIGNALMPNDYTTWFTNSGIMNYSSPFLKQPITTRVFLEYVKTNIQPGNALLLGFQDHCCVAQQLNTKDGRFELQFIDPWWDPGELSVFSYEGNEDVVITCRNNNNRQLTQIFHCC